MKLVQKNRKFRVYDDVLPEKSVAFLWQTLRREPHQSADADHWNTVWSLSEGRPLSGGTIRASLEGAKIRSVESAGNKEISFGYSKGIGLFLEHLAQNVKNWEDLIGVHGENWEKISLRTYIYPAGSGLNWHSDAGDYSGAFAYYIHPSWNIRWGGELLISNRRRRQRGSARKTPSRGGYAAMGLDPSMFSEKGQASGYFKAHFLSDGIGHFVQPKTNRLVVLRGGTLH